MPKKGKKKKLEEQLRQEHAVLERTSEELTQSGYATRLLMAWGLLACALLAVAVPFVQLVRKQPPPVTTSVLNEDLKGMQVKNVAALSLQGVMPPTISLNEGDKSAQSATMRTYRVSISSMTPLASLEIRAPELVVRTIEIRSLSGSGTIAGDTKKKEGFISKRQPFAQGEYEISLMLLQDVPLSGSCTDATQDTGICVFN